MWGKDLNIPDVTRVISEETADDCSIDSFHTALQTPPTPDGLKPRRSIDSIRKELKLPLLQYCIPSREPSSLSYAGSGSGFGSGHTYGQSQSQSTQTRVAESPDFLHPTTAVGALLATPEFRYPTAAATGALVATSAQRPPQQSQFPVHLPLPPRCPTLLPPRTWDDNYNTNLGYQQLDDSYEVATPNRRLRAPSGTNSPASTQASSVQSPAWKYHDYPPSGEDQEHSQIGLVGDVDRTGHYNFESVIDRDFVAMDALTNVSAISASTHGDDMQSLESRYSMKRQGRHFEYDDDVIDDMVMQRKQINQKKRKEKIMFQVVERLQDDVELIHQIEQLSGQAPWITKTPPNREGLLTGFSAPTRSRLLKYCNSLLKEMDTACPEEFFLSPTQFEDYGETHNELREAVSFLMQIVRGDTDEKTWKCKYEIRAAMGILPTAPESKESV